MNHLHPVNLEDGVRNGCPIDLGASPHSSSSVSEFAFESEGLRRGEIDRAAFIRGIDFAPSSLEVLEFNGGILERAPSSSESRLPEELL